MSNNVNWQSMVSDRRYELANALDMSVDTDWDKLIEAVRNLREGREDIAFLLGELQRAADTPSNIEMVSAQQYARNVLDDWSK